MRKVFVFLVCIFLVGCAQRMKLPINRGVSPEVIGVGAGLSMGSSGVAHSSLDIDSTTNDLSGSVSTSVVRESGYDIQLGVARQFEAFAKFMSETPTLYGVKVQFWGLPKKEKQAGHKMTFTFASGSSTDQYDDSGIEIELASKVQDYSFIYGYRFDEKHLVYSSLSITDYRFKGKIKNPPLAFTTSRFSYTAKSIKTLAVGSFHDFSVIGMNLEVALQKLKFTNSSEKTNFSFLYGLNFSI
ncbi:MAG: hypothetical protein N4A33_13470 [Bacteriovoracaceae bacterium]|nr:hypothetical protein [Bacteriovoracaceae bacterium]